MSEYVSIESMKAIADDIKDNIGKDESVVNLVKHYEITKSALLDKKILDCEEDARDWAAEERPSSLFFSHGEYRVGGLDYISEELNRKRTSNRAMYSLVSNEMIINSADNPIPSFMIFQCLFEENDSENLYCTVYFRALEVSKFLSINLEEIRQNIVKLISDGIRFNNVRLLIVAGRAHHTNSFISLKKPEIDKLSPAEIHEMVLDKEWIRLSKLLREKSQVQSVIQLKSLRHLQDFFHSKHTKIEDYPKSILDKCVEIAEELLSLRQKDSHSVKLNELSTELKSRLTELAQLLEDLI